MIGTVQMKSTLQSQVMESGVIGDSFIATAWTIKLVETSFDPKDSTTYPTPSTHFDPALGSEAPYILFDAPSGKNFLFAPEPAGGWTFTSETITDPISVNGYLVYCDGIVIGGNLIVATVISATGQTITLPYATMLLNQAPVPDATTPVPV